MMPTGGPPNACHQQYCKKYASAFKPRMEKAAFSLSNHTLRKMLWSNVDEETLSINVSYILLFLPNFDSANCGSKADQFGPDITAGCILYMFTTPVHNFIDANLQWSTVRLSNNILLWKSVFAVYFSDPFTSW